MYVLLAFLLFRFYVVFVFSSCVLFVFVVGILLFCFWGCFVCICIFPFFSYLLYLLYFWVCCFVFFLIFAFFVFVVFFSFCIYYFLYFLFFYIFFLYFRVFSILLYVSFCLFLYSCIFLDFQNSAASYFRDVWALPGFFGLPQLRKVLGVSMLSADPSAHQNVQHRTSNRSYVQAHRNSITRVFQGVGGSGGNP